MLGIPREVAEHSLKIRPGSKPVRQCLRRFDEKKHRTISEEIAKLSATGFIKEVYHLEWLANPILVRKEWEMEDVCRLYRSQQGMPKGSVSFAVHRPNSRLYLGV